MCASLCCGARATAPFRRAPTLLSSRPGAPTPPRQRPTPRCSTRLWTPSPRIGKPTLSLIRGFCVGGGLELASATDLRLAAADARFGVPIAQLGLLVGYKEMRRLVALVGPGAAMNLLLTARLIDSAEALRLGLVTEVVSPAEVEDAGYKLARRLCGLAPLAARWHKQILQTVLTNPALTGLTAGRASPALRLFWHGRFCRGPPGLPGKAPAPV